MAKPIVHIYQPVDQTGKSHERLEAAGAQLIMPEGTWDLMANSRVSEEACLLYTSPSPRDVEESRMPSSA